MPSADKVEEQIKLSMMVGMWNGRAILEKSVTISYKTKHMTQQIHSWEFISKGQKLKFI